MRLWHIVSLIAYIPVGFAVYFINILLQGPDDSAIAILIIIFWPIILLVYIAILPVRLIELGVNVINKEYVDKRKGPEDEDGKYFN